MSIELRDFAAGKKFRYESFSEEKKEREKVMNGKLKSLRCGTDCRSGSDGSPGTELGKDRNLDLHLARSLIVCNGGNCNIILNSLNISFLELDFHSINHSINQFIFLGVLLITMF